MKPIHLNLAARPYRDVRPLYIVVGAMLALIAFLMVNNVLTYVRYSSETRTTRARTAQLEAQAARERETASAIQQQLKNVDLARLDAQTRFINSRLSERAFSWSALLDALEEVVADDVRLISVAPQFAATGPIQLQMRFDTKSPDGLIETINRMNEHAKFSNPFPGSERAIEGGGFQFDMTAQYDPAAPSETIGAAR